jgi:hypothetical protein
MRELDLADDLRALLGALHASRAAGRSVLVPPVDLEGIEEAIGSFVPDAVLALSVAGGASLSKVVEDTASYDSFSRTTHGKPGRLVVIETWGEWPATSVGFEPTKSRREPKLIVWDWKTWTADTSLGISSVADYVRVRVVPEGQALTPLADASGFRPAVGAAAPVERFVVHAKFGRGRVLGTEDGKLRIAFPDETRTLLAKFVTDA